MQNKILKLWLKNQIQLFSLGSSLVRAGSRFLLILLASHFLPADSFGIFNIFIAIYFFTRIVSDGSLQMPYVKLAAEEGKDRALINAHIAVFKLLYIFVLSLILFAAAGSITDFTGLSEKKLLYLLPGLLLSFGFYSFFCQYLNAALRMAELLVLECIQCLVMLGVIAFYYLQGRLGEVESYIMIFIVTFFLSGIAAMIFYGKGLDFKWKYHRELAGRILYYSRYSMILAMGAMLFLRSDVIMLGHFLAPAQVAVYGIALIVGEVINVILDAIQKVCLPTASLMNSQGGNNRIMALFKGSLRNAYLMSVPIVSVIVVGSPFFLEFFYKGQYDGAFWVIVLLAVSALIKPAGYIGGAILLGAGYVKVDNLNCWLTALMNIVLNLIFIPLWGVIGAAVTTILSYFVLSLLQYRAIKKLFVSA
ncbi:MAG: polysaccharide biosynthesis C-terminal domain-containing protein [Desulfocapsa sp.]|nr:polysaccharide biosynthesis C-terminal domain-containing protein [Desulfocapsa sp.]